MALHNPVLVCDDGGGCAPLPAAGFMGVPPEVQDDARRVARGLFKNDGNKADDMAAQLAAMYLALKDTDVAIIFNPGGWGWAIMEKMPDWGSILRGMKSTLEGLGRRVLVMNYLRTTRSLGGRFSEIKVLMNLNGFKKREMAARVGFMTRHLPGLRVVLAGESNGAAMVEDAMRLLRDNSHVFSVQTGTPWWAPSQPHTRSLIINHNGVEADTFSNGNLGRIIGANIQAALGLYKGNRGNVLLYIGAPGHVYNWSYAAVREKIIAFLKEKVLEATPGI